MSNRSLNKKYRKKGYKGRYLKLRVMEHERNLRTSLTVFIIFNLFIALFVYSPYFGFENVGEKVAGMYFSSVSNI